LAFDVSRASAQQIDPLQGHFYLKGKAPSKFTLDVLNQAKARRYRSRTRLDFEPNRCPGGFVCRTLSIIVAIMRIVQPASKLSTE